MSLQLVSHRLFIQVDNERVNFETPSAVQLERRESLIVFIAKRPFRDARSVLVLLLTCFARIKNFRENILHNFLRGLQYFIVRGEYSIILETLCTVIKCHNI